MFGTIRKHQTWLWAIIITVIIISFVIFFSPYSRMNDSRRGTINYGTINGERVSQEDFANAWREVELRIFFMNQRWPDDTDKKDLEGEAYKWLLLLQKQKQMGIQISSQAAGQTAKAMLSQFQRAGLNSAANFEKQLLQPHGLTMEDFGRFVQHYLGIQEMIGTLGLSGKLITPQEARDLYQREHQELATEAAFFSASNYLAKVTVTPEAIPQFYSNRLSTYRLPERLQVSYVQFDFTNFQAEAKQELAKMTNLDLQIDEAYRQGTTNFLREVKAASLEEAKTKIRDLRLKEFEAQAARRKAGEFANPLFDMEPIRVGNFDDVAKKQGLTVHVTLPFDRENGPKELEVGQDFAQRAFSRTPEDPFAGPVLGRNAAYVLAMNKKIPSEIPPLDQIRSQVETDYKEEQARTMARSAGAAFYQSVTNGLAQGKTFAAICTDAKADLVTLPPISVSTRDLPADLENRVNLNQLKQMAFSTQPGKASQFQPTLDGGIVLYVKAKLPLDQAKMESTLPAFMNYVRQQRQTEAFNEWFSKQVQSSGLRELLQPKPAPSLAPGSRTKKS
jgi:peptidyl-prolyl cis-trans isomerase D